MSQQKKSLEQHPVRKPGLVFAGLATAMLLASLDSTIFAAALPTIAGDLGGVMGMVWVTTAYILASTVTMPVYGRLADVVGRKRLFVVALGIFVLGSIIGGLATSMPVLIVARAVQGLGGGGLITLAQTIVADVIPPRRRGAYLGTMNAIFAVGSVGGPLLGGLLTDTVGWRWAFWINVPLGVLSIFLSLRLLSPDRPTTERSRFDAGGFALLASATIGLVLLATWAGEAGAFESPPIFGLIAGIVAALVLFVFVERRRQFAIIPLGLFRSRNFVIATGAGLLSLLAMVGTVTYLPTYLQMVGGVDAQGAGVLMIPLMAGILVASNAVGWFVARTGRFKAVTITGSLVIATALGLMSTMSVATPIALVCAYLGLAGAGFGMTLQNLLVIVQISAPSNRVGTATATTNYFRQVGGSLGAAIVGTLFTARLIELLPVRQSLDPESITPEIVRSLAPALNAEVVAAYAEALTPVFLVLAPLSLLSALLLGFLEPQRLADDA